MDKISVNVYTSAFLMSVACTGSGGFEFLRLKYARERSMKMLIMP